MMEIRIASIDLGKIRAALLGQGRERCAVLLAARASVEGDRSLLLVREAVIPSDDDYTFSEVDQAQLRPDFVARITKRARLASMALVFVHTHPGSNPPRFSQTDDQGESHLLEFLDRRGLNEDHAAIVISEGGIAARVLGKLTPSRVLSLGDKRVVEYEGSDASVGVQQEVFDRQIRAFGEHGQRVLRGLRVAVVGVGGTGSIAVQQLAHLGVRDFILIDPDTLESTNLNRVVGASALDVGNSKVAVASRFLQVIAPDASVQAIVGDVVHSSVARKLASADFIFGCTDSHGSRAVVQQVAYQYMVPCIDMGSTITTEDGLVTGIFGRIQLLGPGHACLWCSNLLSSEQVRRDMMSAFERQADPYIQGANEAAPSVISLNGTVVSLAVTMLLGTTTDMPVQGRHLIYNARTSTLRAVHAEAKDDCFICSRAGSFARGDSQPLYARHD